MPTLTLLEKVYGPFRPEGFEPTLASLCKGLRVELRVVGSTDRGWIQIEVCGEDEAVASRYLDREIGLAPVFLHNLKRFSTIRGKVVFSGESDDNLYVDIGIFIPQTCDASVQLQTLQTQLADGKKLSLQRLTELFCLHTNLPLRVKVIREPGLPRKYIEAELSESQLSQMTGWIRSSLDRLIVLGAPLLAVERAVKASRHSRDIIRIEPLGLLEHAILCKLGTDAAGLIPKLGPLLPATLVPFSQRKIRRLVSKPY